MTSGKGGLLYGPDDTLPLPVLVLSAFQHIGLATTSIAYQVAIARESGLTLTRQSTLSQLTAGVGGRHGSGVRRRQVCGIGLPVSGQSPRSISGRPYSRCSAVGSLLFGMTMIAGLVQVALAPMIQRLRALLPTEITGLGSQPSGLPCLFGPAARSRVTKLTGIPPGFVAVVAKTLLTIISLNVWTEGYLKAFCLLIGSAAGYFVGLGVGVGGPSAAIASEHLDFIRLPFASHPGWQFDLALLPPFVVGAIASTLHLMGTISTAQRIADPKWVRPSFKSLSGGLFRKRHREPVRWCGRA
jgi:NCS2 family nucleobase:cation symporter-2